MLSLDDPLWEKMEGGYSIPYNPVPILRKLEKAETAKAQNVNYKELWDELHHQGGLGLCSYACVPQLIRIAQTTPPQTYDFFALITVIEVERHENGNPQLPAFLKADYEAAWRTIPQIIASGAITRWDAMMVQMACAALAASKGQRILARAYLEMNTDGALRFLSEETGYVP